MAIKKFTNEDIQKANETSIIDYISKLNLETRKAGKTLKIEGHGGLYIDPVKNKWNCFSEGKGGGPIQLIMYLENKTWVESVKTLLGNSYESNRIQNYKKDVQIEKNKEFILPEKNNTFIHMIAYLIQTRGIDKDIVYNCIQNKTLYEDEKRNCVFVGHDKEGMPKYAGLRGTNTNRVFKGEEENSNKAFSFNIPGSTNRLYIFESPIELMSYLTLYKRMINENEFVHHTLSLGGLAPVALEQYLKDNPNIDGIVICLNNDRGGIDAAKNIRQEYQDKYIVNIEYPQLKDFNEDLVSINRDIQNNSKEVEIKNEEYEEEYEIEI